MKKLLVSIAMVASLGLNAAAYFDGSVSGTTGPGGYRGSNLDLVIGSGNLAFEPSMATYTSDALDKTFRTYALRGAVEAEKYTVGGLVGTTPEINHYSNKFAGGDITFTLTPGSGGHSRLAGPGARGGARSGEGVSRIDVGAGFKYTQHTQTRVVGSDLETGQGATSLFAGAKILMVNLAASYTGYAYGDTKVTPELFLTGQNFVTAAFPKSSINVKLDLPGQPLITPYISYTSAKYKFGVEDSSAYLLGAYIDLNLVTANVAYQIFNNGHAKGSFITLGGGIKF